MIATVSKHRKPSSVPKIESPTDPHYDGHSMKAQDFIDGFPDGPGTLGIQIGATKRGMFLMRIEDFDPEEKGQSFKVMCAFLKPTLEPQKIWTAMTAAEVVELDDAVQAYNEGKDFELCPFDEANDAFAVYADRTPLYLHFIPKDRVLRSKCLCKKL
jgi:hypothetical protein